MILTVLRLVNVFVSVPFICEYRLPYVGTYVSTNTVMLDSLAFEVEEISLPW